MAYSVPAVETAIRLLTFLKDNDHGQKSLAEACDALGIPRSSGFNVMKTLERHGLVKFDGVSKRYSLGWALVELGTKASAQITHVEVIRPYLRELGRDTGLTCVTAQRVGDRLIMVDKVESSNDIRVTATIGHSYPLAGALGKSLIAYLDEGEIRAHVSRIGLPAFTRTSITDVESLLGELAEVRQVGYAKSIEEYIQGVNVAASPVFDASGEVLVIVGAMGLSSYLPAERIGDFGLKVLNTARQATMALGGRWRGPQD